MTKANNTKKMVELAVLAAIVVVLQILSYSIKIFGTFPLSLVLIPIVIAAVLYGPREGALLGAIFGIVVVIASAMGTDLGGNAVWNANPILTIIVCIMKGSLAGFVSGICYRALRRFHDFAASIVAAIVCPIVNTGVFCIFMFLCFRDVLSAWAGGTDLLTYTLFGLVGVNFLIEFGINILFAPAISRIVKAVSKG